MKNNITKIPISTWQRILNSRGKRTVNCMVTGRYFKYGTANKKNLSIGTPVSLDIMTDTGSDRPDQKICTMMVTIEQLRMMLETLEEDVSKE